MSHAVASVQEPYQQEEKDAIDDLQACCPIQIVIEGLVVDERHLEIIHRK
jgi:hypothetical protein